MGDGKDGTEKVLVVDVGSECLVGRTSLAPGVSTAGQVDEDDTKGPEIIGGSIVLFQSLKETTLALGREVKGGTAARVSRAIVHV